MTGPVVCGIDFSDHSRRALEWARLLSERLVRPLLIVHAVEPVLAEAAKITYGPDALRQSIEPELRTFVSPVVGADVPLHIGVGDPASVLGGAAMAHNASLLVVGTQGLGRAARVWFGSTTLRLLRDTTIPILGVPPGASGTPTLASLVVGTDFSEASTAALQSAIALGARCGVPVTCIHTVPTVAAHARWNTEIKRAEDAAVRAARAQIETTMAGLAPGTSVTADVRTGDAADVLVDASATPGTVIVVGLGGAQTTQRPGTTAYRVLSTAASPVLGVPAPRA